MAMPRASGSFLLTPTSGWGRDLLRRAVALAKGKGWDYLTCLPMPELRSFWEKTFMSYWTLGCDVLPFLAWLFAVGTPRAVAALCVLIVLVLHANGSHAGRVSPFYALTHPLGSAIFCYIMLRSAIVTLRRRGVVWRDTFYPLDELRKGVV